jgi:peptide/nickel transport system ATP-binding protein
MQPVLQIENLTISFRAEKERTKAVKNISLSIWAGKIMALVGESGSGKSVTALSILQLLPTPPTEYTNGNILFTEENKTVDILKLSTKELQAIRGNKISMVFQEPMSSLNPVMRCGEQVMEAMVQHKNCPNRRKFFTVTPIN